MRGVGGTESCAVSGGINITGQTPYTVNGITYTGGSETDNYQVLYGTKTETTTTKDPAAGAETTVTVSLQQGHRRDRQ